MNVCIPSNFASDIFYYLQIKIFLFSITLTDKYINNSILLILILF